MTDALKFEVKKDGWKQLQSGSYKLALTLNPADLDDNGQKLLMDFIKAPMGTIYMMGMAEIGDDEQPITAKEAHGILAEKPASEPKQEADRLRLKDRPRSQQAALACTWPDFQRWIGVSKWLDAASGKNYSTETTVVEVADLILKRRLNIKSKTQLDTHADKATAWGRLYAQFQSDTGRTAEQRQ